MNNLDLFREKVYSPMTKALDKDGDKGFLGEGIPLVVDFYKKNKEILIDFETEHVQTGYSRKKVICDQNGIG